MKLGEYKTRGDYHRNLSKEWAYYPLYSSKMKYVLDFFSDLPKGIKILDAGCGEGVFLEELADNGFVSAFGVDKHYSSDKVSRGSILSLPFKEEAFDIVLLLDVIEHLSFEKQEIAIREISRVLKSGGILLASIPNLAHLSSRIKFVLNGKFVRTASVEKHPGDRPIKEYFTLFSENGFALKMIKGFFPTIPFLYKLIQRRPYRFMWLYHLLNMAISIPGICFLNILVYEKTRG